MSGAALFIWPFAPVLAAWAILRAFRVEHPASQHTVWVGALAGILAIAPPGIHAPRQEPALHSALPAQPEADPCAVMPLASMLPRPNHWPGFGELLPIVYLAGVAGFAARQLAAQVLLMRLVGRSRQVRRRIRESAEVIVPVTAGCFVPTVILPAGWREWPSATRRAVLRHEFAHIRRGDLRVAALADSVRTLAWFHPLVWWVKGRIAMLSEMACDAAVVECGAGPGEYCRLLVQFAGLVAHSGYRTRLPGLAIAASAGLDRRVDGAFAASRGLRKLRRAGWVAALAMAPALCLAAVDFGTSAPVRRSMPWRILMFFQTEHVGKLAPELFPGERAQTVRLLPATAAERAALPAQLAEQDKVFSGSESVNFVKNGPRIKLALVEPAGGEPYLFADVNLNGAFEAAERFDFRAPKGTPILHYPEVTLKLPISAGPYSIFPIRMILPETRIYRMDPKNDGGRYLLRNPFVFVQGTVGIGGKPVEVKCELDAEKSAAYPDYGWLGMDTNGDGWIDERANSDEFSFAKDESVLFHVNGRDVSIVSVDLKAGTFVVREHAAGDNPRISLKVGDTVPDFAFTDLDGKPRRFSEFRGKYVLLDFWGTWCGPCRRELPDLEKAYRQFRARGLVILGMDDDKDSAAARKVLAEAGATYPQSSGETGNALVYKRFRINRFPTKVLLDPEGRVMALDSDGGFDRDHIAATLDKLLPQAQ